MYMVSELIDGESLRGSTLPLRKSLDIAAQIADGLSAAHAAGVTQRDLKPDNIMVTRDGRVKLLDFGVAKITRLPSDADATVSPEREGVVTGTLGYMAPEQVRAREVDGRADIFSFGALLYELLTDTRALQVLPRIPLATLPVPHPRRRWFQQRSEARRRSPPA